MWVPRVEYLIFDNLQVPRLLLAGEADVWQNINQTCATALVWEDDNAEVAGCDPVRKLIYTRGPAIRRNRMHPLPMNHSLAVPAKTPELCRHWQNNSYSLYHRLGGKRAQEHQHPWITAQTLPRWFMCVGDVFHEADHNMASS